MRRAVFLDRDGVINDAPLHDGTAQPAITLAGLRILPGVPEALARLHGAGFLLVLVTNQPDVARGRSSRAEVEAIHRRMRETLPLDDVRVCYHDDADACACRKPAPGMLFAAAVEHEIQLPRSFMVGDRWRDVEAGHNAGCTTVLVDRGNPEGLTIPPDLAAPDLAHAADLVLARADLRGAI